MKSPLERLVEIQQAQAQEKLQIVTPVVEDTLNRNLVIKDSSLTVNLNINLDAELAQRLAAGAAMLGTAIFFKASSGKIKIPMTPKVVLRKI